MKHIHARVILSTGILVFSQPTWADALSDQLEQLRQSGSAIHMVTPIYSQVLYFSIPKGFHPVLESTSNGRYIQELVPAGEAQRKWTQKVTALGFQSLSSMKDVKPEMLNVRLAQGFKKDCPESFSFEPLGAINLSGYEASAVLIGCGASLPTGTAFSEAMLSIVIKGEKDFYNLQWAERGEASTSPFKFSAELWVQRLNALKPLIVCTPKDGEAAPYDSCIPKKINLQN